MSVKIIYVAAFALATFRLPVAHAQQSSSTAQPPETIVVTGSPITQDRSALATIVDSVDRSQILQSGGANLADALANEPGVTGTSFAAGASRPVIRGFDANRVRILENGIGSFDVSDVGPDHGVPIDPLSTERLELVRGAATLRYGSQAIGGVVNAINNRVPETLPEKPVLAELTGTYGSGSDARQGSAQIDARAGEFAIHADAFDRRADDYDIPDGTQSNSYMDGSGYSLGGSYFFGDSRFGLGAVHYDAQYGIPGEDTYIDMKQTRRCCALRSPAAATRFKHVTFEGGHADYEHSEIDPATGEAAGDVQGQRMGHARRERVRPDRRVLRIGRGAAAAEPRLLGARRRRGLPAADDDAHATPSSCSPRRRWARRRSGCRPARASRASTSRARRRRTNVDVAKLHAGQRVAGFPVRRERVDSLRRDAVERRTRPGPDGAVRARTARRARHLRDRRPDAERGACELARRDVALQYRSSRASKGRCGSRAFSDYIFGEVTGRTCDDEGLCVDDDSEELKELNYTQVDATFDGAEGKASFALADGGNGQLRLDLLADYVRAKIDNGGGNVPRIPPYHVGLGLHWDGSSLDAGFMVRYTADQTDVAVAETPTDGFTSLDAHLGWHPLQTHPGFELAVVGRNLTDTVQRNAVALNKDDVVLPGETCGSWRA